MNRYSVNIKDGATVIIKGHELIVIDHVIGITINDELVFASEISNAVVYKIQNS